MVNSSPSPFALRCGPGFSLSEAARIRHDFLRDAQHAHCPRCSTSLRTIGGARAQGLCMATCTSCGMSLVFQPRPEEPVTR